MELVWSDPLYGMSDPNHYQVWVAAANNRSSGDYRQVIQYFNMDPVALNVLLDQISGWSKGVEGVVDNWYCGNNKEGEACDNDLLTFMQLSQSSITAHPPPGVDPTDSFC